MKNFEDYCNTVTLVEHSEFEQTAHKCSKTSFMAYKKTASNTKTFNLKVSAGVRAGRNYGESQYSLHIN